MDIICKCGHNKKVHEHLRGNFVCLCVGPYTSINDCPCFEYVPDNLSHIENLAKEKGLI